MAKMTEASFSFNIIMVDIENPRIKGQFTIRADTMEEWSKNYEGFTLEMEERGYARQGSAETQPNPSVAAQDSVGQESQDPNDPKKCLVHNVVMTNHQNKNNDGNHWRHDTDDPAYNKEGKFPTVYCFGRPA